MPFLAAISGTPFLQWDLRNGNKRLIKISHREAYSVCQSHVGNAGLLANTISVN